jgi:hypothetical protein
MVVCEVAAPFGLDESGVPEHPQVLRHCPGRNAQEIGQGPDAKRALSQESHDLKTLVRGKRPEYLYRFLRLTLGHRI